MYMILPVYIAEISPKDIRGRLGSVIGPGLNIGIMLGAAFNIGYAKFPLGWRVASGTMAVLTAAFTVGVVFIPHTPRYVQMYLCIYTICVLYKCRG
jgi:hypothetical protein